MCVWRPNLVICLALIFSMQCLAYQCPLRVKQDSEGHYVAFADKKFYLARDGIYETTVSWRDCIVDIDLQPFVEGVGDTHRHCTKMCRVSYPELSEEQWAEYMQVRMEEAKERSTIAGNEPKTHKF